MEEKVAVGAPFFPVQFSGQHAKGHAGMNAMALGRAQALAMLLAFRSPSIISSKLRARLVTSCREIAN